MPKKQKGSKSLQVGVRLSIPTIERIDAFAARFEQKTPGMHINRSDAIRIMIEHWLSKIEAETKSVKREPKG